jgi:hypothetical protein
MKTALGFLTEEGRTRSKNAARRIWAYAALMVLIGGASGYGIHRYWVTPQFTVLQRVYFKQYLKSSYRSYLRNSRSHYTTLARIVTDPRTRKDVAVPVMDDQIDAVYDEQGRIAFDEHHYPKLLIKPEVERKKFYWAKTVYPDMQAYDWYRTAIYDGKTIPDIWRPAWLGAIIIFLLGTIVLMVLDILAQQLYLKGEPLRGTRELSPKAYAREHRKQLGYRVRVYATS